jgi:hypothetical protein
VVGFYILKLNVYFGLDPRIKNLIRDLLRIKKEIGVTLLQKAGDRPYKFIRQVTEVNLYYYVYILTSGAPNLRF